MADRATSHLSYFGSIVAALSGLTLSEWSAIFGILLGFGTFLINNHYKHKEDIRKQKEFELRQKEFEIKMKQMRKQINEKN
ncbi:MAG: hypothetical protein CR960_00610 [Pasteurellales bacterium]|nr:MAG: hypothetical protein CR960_00610 [Pasteurellales bacterium]